MMKELPQGQFDTAVRWIKRGDAERLAELDTILTAHVARLGLLRKVRRRAADLVIVGVPNGSDQYDGGSLNDWAARITTADKVACDQIAALAATVKNRLGG